MFVVVVVVVVSLFWLGPPLGFFERVYLNYRTCDAYLSSSKRDQIEKWIRFHFLFIK